MQTKAAVFTRLKRDWSHIGVNYSVRRGVKCGVSSFLELIQGGVDPGGPSAKYHTR